MTLIAAYLFSALYYVRFFVLVQTESAYIIIHERAELVAYNTSVVKDVYFKVSKINRTTFALNISFDVLVNVPADNMRLKVGVSKLYGTEYKVTATSLSVNVCGAWQKNMLGIPNQVKMHGNIDACHMSPNKYYLHNFVPKLSSLPKYLRSGSYKIVIDAQDKNGALFFVLNWYAKLEKQLN